MQRQRLALGLTLAVLIVGCKSEEKKQADARQAVRSWTAGIALTCANAQKAALPQQFVARANHEAFQKLQQAATALPPREKQAALRAARDSTCSSARSGS